MSGKNYDGLEIANFTQKRVEADKKRQAAIEEDRKNNIMIDVVNKNYDRVTLERELQEKKRKGPRNRGGKKRKKELISLLIKRTAAVVLIGSTAAATIGAYRMNVGEEYIIEEVSKLEPTGKYTYWDVSARPDSIQDFGVRGNGIRIKRFCDDLGKEEKVCGPDDIKELGYEDAIGVMDGIRDAIVKKGNFPEEWTPIFIENTVGTNLFNNRYKGSDFLSMCKTKLEAYDMKKRGEEIKKEGGISR